MEYTEIEKYYGAISVLYNIKYGKLNLIGYFEMTLHEEKLKNKWQFMLFNQDTLIKKPMTINGNLIKSIDYA